MDTRSEEGAPQGRLRAVVDELVHTLPAGSAGIEFGCGRSAALANLLGRAGLPCHPYDERYFPDEQALTRQYDYVVCTGTVETTRHPAELFALFGRLLAPRGVLGILTQLYDGTVPFAQWWYRRETARSCFYTQTTLRWIALQNRWKVRFTGPDIALFRV